MITVARNECQTTSPSPTGERPRAASRALKVLPEEPASPGRGGSRLAGWLTAGVGQKGLKTYRLRLLIQAFFAFASVLLGVQFARFLAAVAAGDATGPIRPPGVEGYLPISGLMGLVDWIYQGSLNTVHPAATVLLCIFLVIVILFRKAFCAWICPVGFFSETLARLGRLLFGRNFRPWRFFDIPLRGLKYLLLGFFLWAIFISMDAAALREFIESPYNRVSDIKMYLFFARLSGLGAAVIGALIVGSVFIHGFWCRYLCPYGALFGLFSWFSPTKVRRIADSCTACGKCDEVCMARLPVSKKERIISPECTGCLDCVASCPKSQTLTMGGTKWRWGVISFAAAVLVVFLGGYVLARVAGAWQNEVSHAEYVHRLTEIDDPVYGHPGR